ncbi:hypothetical protein TCON_0389 [Astathelohania contejeani]|uniref:Spc7 kinetochore protein domain-containing protein n=1 Tax=Astathelohania contejeani TaxID=164912 RepID=A0ABQ7I1T3_9MICR|nr:hypothetical protein TCON_0389 [Thelohania contejeani]
MEEKKIQEPRKSQEPKKRVSFAAETKIKYLYADDTSKSSSPVTILNIPDEGDLSMNMTCDYTPLVVEQMERLEREEEESSNKNVLPVIVYNEQEKEELKAFNEKITSNIFEISVEDIINENILDKDKTTIGLQEDENSKNKILDETKAMDEIKAMDETKVMDNKKEEIINTVDLRKFIPEAKKEKINLPDFLTKHGIRFLDDLVIINSRRETLSKSRNSVNESQIKFYDLVIQERINYFNMFSSDIGKWMEEDGKINKRLEEEFEMRGSLLDTEGVDLNQLLRSLKAMCRTKAKIKWYEIRKNKEIGLKEIIFNNKLKIESEYNTIKKKREELNEIYLKNKAEFEKLSEEVGKMEIEISKSDPSHVKKVDVLNKSIEEQDQVLESIKNELRDLMDTESTKIIEEQSLKKQISVLKEEINFHEKAIKRKNITEAEVEKIKREYKAFCSIFKYELVKLDRTFFEFHFLDYKIGINFEVPEIEKGCNEQENLTGNISLIIKSIDISSTKESDIVFEFGILAIKNAEIIHSPLKQGIRHIIETLGMVNAISKELKLISKKYETTNIIKENKLVIGAEIQKDENSTTIIMIYDIYFNFRYLIGPDKEYDVPVSYGKMIYAINTVSYNEYSNQMYN